MVYNHLAGDIKTPQQRRPSDHTWSKSTLRTPSGEKKSNPRTAGLSRARASPYTKPDEVRVELSPGNSCAMELFTPKEHMAKLALRQKAAGSMTPTNPHVASSTNTLGESPLFGQPKRIIFPPNLGVREPSIKLVSPPMEGTPRTEERPPVRDPTCPTVRLLSVMYKCWDDDGTKQSDWTLTDGLLNGRNDERDRRGMWSTLGGAVSGLWPDPSRKLQTWIMLNEPSDDDTIWFKSAGSIGVKGEEYITDPKLDTKDSTLDRVGFHMTASTYDVACNIIQLLAGPNLKGDLQCLVGEINPFFLIYACADCNVPLPKNFGRQLFWKHLDGIVRAKCWRGLCQTRANTQYNKSANADNVRRKIFQKGEHDQDDTLQSLIRISCGAKVHRTVHRLQITIDGYKWVAKAQMGTVWYRAGDLYDDDDIACFAVIDCLTRFLPSYEGGILEICSGHIPLLWGVGGEPKGAWSVVQAICKKYQVKLRVKWTGLEGPAPSARVTSAEAAIEVPPRNRDVVDAVMDEFTQNELGSKAAYRLMMDHLQRVTTKT